ncbi:hypothetical protein EI94DRAFT_1720481 [Lactarius quietus]|nr:hypothetical protein EI94DRAFT_1720481 [Lactarius quietus]
MCPGHRKLRYLSASQVISLGLKRLLPPNSSCSQRIQCSLRYSPVIRSPLLPRCGCHG